MVASFQTNRRTILLKFSVPVWFLSACITDHITSASNYTIYMPEFIINEKKPSNLLQFTIHTKTFDQYFTNLKVSYMQTLKS